jgi:prepilin-type N-terminal cleavage/methylation domain-containing protein
VRDHETPLLRAVHARRPRRRPGFTLIETLVVVLILGILLGIAVPLFLSATRHSAVQAAKANLHMIARSAQAYRMKAGSYPADFTTAGATPPAEFVGSGRDLNQVPSGPRAVVYTWSTTATGSASAGEFVVTATESAAAADAFGDPDTIDSIRFNLSTGRFSDETTAPGGHRRWQRLREWQREWGGKRQREPGHGQQRERQRERQREHQQRRQRERQRQQWGRRQEVNGGSSPGHSGRNDNGGAETRRFRRPRRVFERTRRCVRPAITRGDGAAAPQRDPGTGRAFPPRRRP